MLSKELSFDAVLRETFLPGRDLWEWTPPAVWQAPVVGGAEQKSEHPAAGALVDRATQSARHARLVVVDRRVIFGKRTLDLAARPHMLSLFRAFMGKAEDVALDADALLVGVYGVNFPIGRSPRYIASCRANCVKLVSRARYEAEAMLSGEHGACLSWFPYDRSLRSWRLLAFRTGRTGSARAVARGTALLS